MALPRRKANPDDEALSEIRSVFGLSEHELADLFGVRRESVIGWRRNGIPDTRRASVERMLDLARVLYRDLKPERIPEIVRTHDDWLTHGTMLQTIAREGPDAVYAYLRRLFSYAG
jgi:transcriptional regulator with XRE-family HTH domain